MNNETKEQKDTPPKTVEQLKSEAYDLMVSLEKLQVLAGQIVNQIQQKNQEIQQANEN